MNGRLLRTARSAGTGALFAVLVVLSAVTAVAGTITIIAAWILYGGG